MIDRFGRDIDYLRLSVTDRCNLRCRYCMPETGVCKKSHAEMLTEDETITAIEAAAALGIRKLRITGGEPLIKKNILSICRRAAAVPGIREVCLTTNGILLSQFAGPLKQAGVSRLNLSLDTLNAEKYAYMTRLGKLEDFYQGLEAALGVGFEKIKINAVLIGGFNDDEIVQLAQLSIRYPVDVRFIELMPMYDGGDFDAAAYIPCSKVLEQLPAAEPVPPDGGIARLYRLPGAQGNIGLIHPVSAHFCAESLPPPAQNRRPWKSTYHTHQKQSPSTCASPRRHYTTISRKKRRPHRRFTSNAFSASRFPAARSAAQVC